MTRIKLCGLKRMEDIQKANELKPDYIGFVFAQKSKRAVTKELAKELKAKLDESIQVSGVFVNEDPDTILELLEEGIIDVAQLHGSEDETYIKKLKKKTKSPVVKAFSIESDEDIEMANRSSADYVLLDSGAGGTGTSFDWSLVAKMKRDYFLAGGLTIDNVDASIRMLHPFAVDVSSGIETDGVKDPEKMEKFVEKVRKEL